MNKLDLIIRLFESNIDDVRVLLVMIVDHYRNLCSFRSLFHVRNLCNNSLVARDCALNSHTKFHLKLPYSLYALDGSQCLKL